MLIQISFLCHYVVTRAQVDTKNVTLEKKHTFMLQPITCAPPKVLNCRKSEQTAENLGQNGGQCCLISTNGIQHFQQNTWRPFFGCRTKKRSSWSLIFVEKFCTKSPTKRSGQIWENSGKNLSHPQKFPSPKTMYIYRFSIQIWMVFRGKRNRKPFWVVSVKYDLQNLEIYVSVIFCHVIYWGSLVLGSSNSLQSCVCPSILDNDPP